MLYPKKGLEIISLHQAFDMNSWKRQGTADIKWAFGPNRFNLEFLGLWRFLSDCKTRTILSDIRFALILLIMISSCILPCLLALEKVWGNFSLMIENLQYTLPITAAVIKLLTLWSKREVLAIMNDMVLTDWLKTKTEEERKVMKSWTRVSRLITIGGNVVAYTTLFITILLPWCGISIRVTTNMKDLDNRFILQSYFTYDLTKTINFILTYVIQTFGVVTGVISYTGVDNYLIVLVLHICGQFHNLNGRILNLDGYKNFKYELAYCVQEHIRLLRFIEIIDGSFMIMLLVILIYFGCIFCFYCYIVISQVSRDVLHFGRILFMVFAVLFTFSHMCLFCVIGEILVVKSDSIFHTIYDYEWYRLNPENARCLIYLMIRASRPSYITAGKLFPMTMATLGSLLKTSGGYISVLLANQGSENDSK